MDAVLWHYNIRTCVFVARNVYWEMMEAKQVQLKGIRFYCALVEWYLDFQVLNELS